MHIALAKPNFRDEIKRTVKPLAIDNCTTDTEHINLKDWMTIRSNIKRSWKCLKQLSFPIHSIVLICNFMTFTSS